MDVCPVDCFYEAEDQLVINPDECIDCGACVPECPVEAIFAEEDVPEKWTAFTAKNAEAFKGGVQLKMAAHRADWEAEKARPGTEANLYYDKYKAAT